MTVFEVEELCRYWADHPPAHIAAAALFGLGKREPRRTGPAAGLGPGFAAGDVHQGLTPVVLDFAALKRRTENGPSPAAATGNFGKRARNLPATEDRQ